jgi:uncharacterized damage-inducible protein DinB
MTILDRLLRHDAWTTRALLTLAANLPDADLDREFDIGHRTLRRTFTHIIQNMECWHDLMAARPQRAITTTPPDSIPSLITRLDTVAAQLLTLAQSIEQHHRVDDYFTDTLDTTPRHKPFGAALVHLATHAMHHRAQCLHILRRLGLKNLPEGDALTWEKSHLGLGDWPTA